MTAAYAETDRCTDIILDFIAGPESGGNYNAYFGNSGATRDLSRLSLDEIYAFQDTLTNTAIGRYQFIHLTLLSLQNRLNLSGSTLFTQVLQDRLAVELLIDCKYPAWWRGQLANDEFAHNLSEVWASLPDPEKGGASHYDNQHAGVTLAAVYDMLIRAREAQAMPAPAPIPEPNPTPGRDPETSEALYVIAQQLLSISARLAQ